MNKTIHNSQYKKVLCIHDLSCIGRCSLTTAIPVLSSMGVEAVPLPTAIYSMHTGYEGFKVLDTSDFMSQTLKSWQNLDLKFDAIFSGFLKGTSQVEILKQVLNTYKCLSVIDPAFSDDGELYSGFDLEFVKKFREDIMPMAEILVPNIYEAMYLTDTPCTPPPYSIDFVESLLRKLDNIADYPGGYIIIKGIQLDNGEYGVAMIQTPLEDFDPIFYDIHFFSQEHIKGNYSGAGDLWASILVGNLVNNETGNYVYPENLKRAIINANKNTALAIQNTKDSNLSIDFYNLTRSSNLI